MLRNQLAQIMLEWSVAFLLCNYHSTSRAISIKLYANKLKINILWEYLYFLNPKNQKQPMWLS